MFCENCGAQIEVGQKFCAACGTPVEIMDTAEANGYKDYQKQSSKYQQFSRGSSLSVRTTAIISYITFIGLLIAIIAGDREGAKFHINQALVIWLFSFLTFIPYIGWIWGIFVLICWIFGLIYAIDEEEKEVPLLGKIHILK